MPYVYNNAAHPVRTLLLGTMNMLIGMELIVQLIACRFYWLSTFNIYLQLNTFYIYFHSIQNT